MKIIKIAAVLIFTMGMFFTSCNEGKKEVKEVEKELEVVKEEVEQVTEHEHSEEMATATYQCPMKCEADKTYPEAGSCPVCKMDLKELDVEVSNDTDNSEATKEEDTDDQHKEDDLQQ